MLFFLGNWWNSERCYEGARNTIESVLGTNHSFGNGNGTAVGLNQTTTPVEEYWE